MTSKKTQNASTKRFETPRARKVADCVYVTEPREILVVDKPGAWVPKNATEPSNNWRLHLWTKSGNDLTVIVPAKFVDKYEDEPEAGWGFSGGWVKNTNPETAEKWPHVFDWENSDFW